MNFFKQKQSITSEIEARPSPQQNPLQHAFSSLQTHFSNFVHNFQPNPALSTTSPLFARIPNPNNSLEVKSSGSSTRSVNNHAMSNKDIEERLSGIPVYALSSGAKNFVVLGGNEGKSVVLVCVSASDADSLLQQMKSVDSSVKSDTQVVPVALSQVVQLKEDGVAFRLVPEASQIKNALNEWKRTGAKEHTFPGVPVFQSKSLIMMGDNKRYRPVFLRKEDLDKSLLRASQDQRQLNPSFTGNIQVAALEEIIQGMKDSSSSQWDDVVFIPPGVDMLTDPSQQS